jgi:RNA recognition motif-containing protein
MKPKQKIKEVFVGSIDFETTEEDLHKLFSVCGTVRAIHLLKDPQGRFSGAAFIRMASEAENRDAINMLDGARLGHRCISVVAPRAKTETVVEPELPEKRSRRRRTPKGKKKTQH